MVEVYCACCDKKILRKLSIVRINRYNYCNRYCKSRFIDQETRDKISETLTGRKASTETKNKLSKMRKGRKCPYNIGNKYALGYKHTDDAKEKMRLHKAGCKLSDNHKNKIAEKLKGRIFTEEEKLKISNGRIGKHIGKDHYRWQGGLSFEPYAIDWTETLRRSIRERDKYTCQLCKMPQGDNTYPVHHIDYDKKNNNPSNLITLCHSCHSKTNYNREYWKDKLEKYFG